MKTILTSIEKIRPIGSLEFNASISVLVQEMEETGQPFVYLQVAGMKYVELDDDDDIVHRRVELQQVAQRTLALLSSSSSLPSLLTLAASSFLLCKVIVDIPLFSCCSARVIKDVLARLRLTNFEDGETILSKVSSGATPGAQYRSQWCIM